jgi:uncharacterized membrane protein YfcA
MDLSWISAIAPWLLTRQTALLLLGGFVVGIFSVIVGGGFFVSIPLLQFLFPSVSYGAIVGNLKVGSFFRGIGSTITNRKEIDWLGNLLWSVPLVIGTVLGVMVIAHLHQHWMLPAIIAAIALSELAPWLAKRITKSSFPRPPRSRPAPTLGSSAPASASSWSPSSASSIPKSTKSRT